MALTLLDLTEVPDGLDLEIVWTKIASYLVASQIDASEVIFSSEINAGVSVQKLKTIAMHCGVSDSLVSWRLPLRRSIIRKSPQIADALMELLRIRMGAQRIVKLSQKSTDSKIDFIEVVPTTNSTDLEGALAEIPGFSSNSFRRIEHRELSRSIAVAWPSDRKSKVFVDISSIIKNDLGTGIQRVIRNLIPEILYDLPDNYEFSLIAADEYGGPFYCVDFTQGKHSDEIKFTRSREVAEFVRSDIFLGLDLNYGVTRSHSNYFAGLQRRGVKLISLVYDLLPIQFPQFFPKEVSKFELHTRYLEILSTFDICVAISRSVEVDYVNWVQTHSPKRLISQQTGHIPLGSGLKNNTPTQRAQAYGSYFLHVGTIEPRKNVEQILDAFEIIWGHGSELSLVLVGKAGWNVDKTVARIRSHNEIGKKLHWLQNSDDAEISDLYRNADCLIMASWGEGYGLPIVEAHSFGTRVLARNIPVFKEVGGPQDFYFTGASGQDLADAVLAVPKTLREKQPVRAPTWKNAASSLISHFKQNPVQRL